MFDPQEQAAYNDCLKQFEHLVAMGVVRETTDYDNQRINLYFPPYLPISTGPCLCSQFETCLIDDPLFPAPSCPLTALYTLCTGQYLSRAHADWAAVQLGIPPYVAQVFIDAADGKLSNSQMIEASLALKRLFPVRP